MRTVTGAETTVLNSAHFATFARVLVEDADGTYQDLTDQDSIDWVHSGRIAQTIDQIVATGDFTFWRKQEGGNSLAPLDEASLLNRDIVPAYAPLIDVGRGIRCDFATIAIGASPGGSDWKRVFTGVIDRWNVEDDFVLVSARDAIGAEIADRWIEAETDYGTGPGRAIEDVMQDILTAWTTGITLYTPASPSFLVTTYTQQRSSVMDALQQLAALVGWVIQPKWDDGTSAYRLTFYEPVRAPASTDWTWADNRYEAIPNFSLDRLHIRNALSLWYTNTSGVRSQVTASDATSITNYDRQWMEIEEPDDSPIDTATEAQDMIDAALLDLKDPIANQEMKTFCFWPVQLCDYFQFNGNAVHYSANQAFGITGFRHEFGGGHIDTFIRTRGKPAGFIKPWIARGNVVAPSLSVTTFRQASAPTATQIGDLWIDSDDGDRLYRWSGTAWVDVQDDDIAQAISDAAGAQSTADGRNTMFRQASAPTANATGDLWFDSDDGDHIYQWSGSAWVSVLPDIDTADLIGNIDLDTQVSGTLSTSFAEAGLINTSVTINADGTLTGAGGGQASLTSLPGSVQVGSIAANAVTAGTIAALAVTAAEIAANTITAGQIAANTITAAEIAANTITATQIAANTITAAEIAASTITASEMNVATLSAITANLGTVTAGTINAAVIVAATSFTASNPVFDGIVKIESGSGNDRIAFTGDTGGGGGFYYNTGNNAVLYVGAIGASSEALIETPTVRTLKIGAGSITIATTATNSDILMSPVRKVQIDESLLVDKRLGVGVLHATKMLNVEGAVSAEFIAALLNTSTGTPKGLQIFYNSLAPNNTTRQFLFCHDSSALRMEVRSNGGIANYQSNDVDLSDATLKDIAGSLGSTWDAVAALEVDLFRYTDNPNSRMMIGPTAQAAQVLFPGSVSDFNVRSGARKLGINHKDMLYSLWKTVQECQARIKVLEPAA